MKTNLHLIITLLLTACTSYGLPEVQLYDDDSLAIGDELVISYVNPEWEWLNGEPVTNKEIEMQSYFFKKIGSEENISVNIIGIPKDKIEDREKFTKGFIRGVVKRAEKEGNVVMKNSVTTSPQPAADCTKYLFEMKKDAQQTVFTGFMFYGDSTISIQYFGNDSESISVFQDFIASVARP